MLGLDIFLSTEHIYLFQIKIKALISILLERALAKEVNQLCLPKGNCVIEKKLASGDIRIEYIKGLVVGVLLSGMHTHI